MEYIENLENKVKLFHCSKIPFFFLQKIKRKKGGELTTRHQHLSLSSIHIPASKAGGGPWLARVHSFRASPCTSPLRRRAYFIPLPGLAIPHHKRSRAQATRSTTPSSAPVPARDQQDQHVLLRRQLRVRRRLQVRHRMRRVRI